MFQVALDAAVLRLAALKNNRAIEDFALIGGFAVARWGIPRATSDIDFAIKLASSSPESVAEMLSGEYRAGDISDPLAGAISFIEGEEGNQVPIQLVLFHPAWEEVAFENVQVDSIDNVSYRFVTWSSLVLLKLFAGSALDLEDASQILRTVQPSTKELDGLMKKAASLRVSKRLAGIIE